MPEEKIVKTNYVSNSHKSKDTPGKAERPKMEKVVTSEVLQPKKGVFRRMAEAFSGDDIQSVGSFVMMDVILPTLKTLISDVASQGVERMLFGDSRPRSGGIGGGMRTNYTSYNRMSSSGPVSRFEEPRTISRQARASHDFGEIVLSSRGEAEEVLERLQDSVNQYDMVTVADLYDLVGLTSQFTDNKWGWTDLRGAGIRRVRAGYLVDLPRTVALD